MAFDFTFRFTLNSEVKRAENRKTGLWIFTFTFVFFIFKVNPPRNEFTSAAEVNPHFHFRHQSFYLVLTSHVEIGASARSMGGGEVLAGALLDAFDPSVHPPRACVLSSHVRGKMFVRVPRSGTMSCIQHMAGAWSTGGGVGRRLGPPDRPRSVHACMISPGRAAEQIENRRSIPKV